jgi:hydrogenase expression/formation protein HypD
MLKWDRMAGNQLDKAMKYVDEYRDIALVRNLSKKIHEVCTGEWTIMEICGGQTHSIMKYSLGEFLPDNIHLVHGPGCPVCVTPLEIIDKAIRIAQRKDVIFCSFGDMLRIPGSEKDLLGVKAEGGDVRILYSPLDALKIALENPEKQVVFFAIGFETTAPANAMAVKQAQRKGITNFSILNSHVLVPPAMEAILSSPHTRIQGFLAAGHVCTVMGYEQYLPIASKYRVPIVVTGFEPVDILQGIYRVVLQLEQGSSEVENAYGRVVTREGNLQARKLLEEVFETADMKWRGIGRIPESGFRLAPAYKAFDAENIFDVGHIVQQESEKCIAGEVLQGLKKPGDCPAFATECKPEHPLGAPMVSSEGACAAYYRFKKTETL